MGGIARISKSFLRIRGPDSANFLNGLITTRLIPNVVKKKQHTISANENRHLGLNDKVDLLKNWGVMHEDIYDPDQNIYVTRTGIFSMFLNSKGRVINECFNYPIPFHTNTSETQNLLNEGPNYLLEVSPVYEKLLLSLLKIHKLSAKVKIDKATEIYAYYYYNDTPEFEEWLENIQQKYFFTADPKNAILSSNSFMKSAGFVLDSYADHVVGFAIDNRVPNFGIKVLTNTPVERPALLLSAAFVEQFGAQHVSEELITQRRFVNGLFETSDAISKQTLLPFEANLDYVNGLSLEKGCYVGQELTIRTFNGGVIRKRIVPVEFDRNVTDLLDGVDLSTIEISRPKTNDVFEESHTGLEAGQLPFASPFGLASTVTRRGKLAKLVSINGSHGFMLVAVDEVGKDELFEFQVGSVLVSLKAHLPEWWPEE